MTELLIAIAGGLLVGASLGMVGAGGAILSVPIFEVLLGHPPKDAVAEALLVTFAVAAVSTVRAARARLVDWHRVVLLGVPGFIGAALGGWLAHDLPDRVQMGLFGAVALVAAWRMALAAPKDAPDTVPDANGGPTSGVAPHAAAGAPAALEPPVPPARAPIPASTRRLTRRALVEAWFVGLGIGLLTGLIGVGGGFLLVPALALLLRVPMRVAVGTSLAIIVLNSAVGFVGNRLGDPREVHPDWLAVGVVAGFGIAGSLLGSALAGRVHVVALRRTFAALLVVVAVVVVFRHASSPAPGPGGEPPRSSASAAPAAGVR